MKKSLLGLALAATLVAAWFAPDDEADLIAPAIARSNVQAAGPVKQEPAAAPPNINTALAIRPREQDDELGSAFGGGQWQNPSPLKPQAARVAIQQASATKSNTPAVPPIRVLGRYVEDGKVAYFLQVGERNVMARVGDKVGDDYHLDSDGPNGLTFTYLPLNQQQVLAAGDTN
jgi:hypothetical protein